MATARLVNPERIPGRTAYAVDASLPGEPPFRGPEDRDRSDFRAGRGDVATYRFRSGADHVRRA